MRLENPRLHHHGDQAQPEQQRGHPGGPAVNQRGASHGQREDQGTGQPNLDPDQ